MKKIINDPSRVVSETLMGMEKAHPELKYTPEPVSYTHLTLPTT